MTDDTHPEAMDLADWLEAVGGGPSAKRCAALLREQHARIAELESELEAIGAGGVSGPLMGIASPPTAQGKGWISVEDARKPPPGKPVVFWAWAERYQEDDEGRQIAQDASGLHLGEWRESENGNYFDNYSTPFADREAVLWWMDPTPPTSAEGVEHG